MKKIIPFKKEIIFKTNLAEITSISLEHSLHKEKDHLISGSFALNGEYKVTDDSTNTEIFSYDLPFDIHMDEHYVLDNIVVDIDDFYYEIVNENVLAVNIDVCVDKLEELPLIEEEFERVLIRPDPSLFEEQLREDEREMEKVMEEEKRDIKNKAEELKGTNTNDNYSIFDTINDDGETYVTYRIYIIREGDSIESILNRYSITRDELALYNDLSNVNLGDKLIIPAVNNENS